MPAITKRVLALLVLVACGVGSGAAFVHAAPAEVTGTITIPAITYTYGDYVTPEATYTGRISQHGDVYVTIVCLADGVVYQSSAQPGSSFLLADQLGDGLDWPGTAADCVARLTYRVIKGKSHSYTTLDEASFHVNALV